MDKSAPSPARILAMVAFAFSCFGLLVFLWISFGGSVPLAPQSYRFHAQFQEAALLVNEADVRISGLTVGHVKSKDYRPSGGVLVEMDIDPQFAPIPEDTRAILRQKTLLGQVYVELTPGSGTAEPLPDGGTLVSANVEDTVEIDEVIGTFDKPLRRAFQGFMKEAATAIEGNEENLNDALGSLPRFVLHGEDLLRVVDEQEPAVRLLVRNAGEVFDALSTREGELGSLVVNADTFFEALASRDDALAETIAVLPTFLSESRMTVERLERFSNDARPLVQDLTPAARNLKPAIQEMGGLAPDLKRLFGDLDVLIEESDETLPNAARFLRGAEPVFEGLRAFLPELNPFLSFASYQRSQVADFITAGGASLSGVLPSKAGGGPRHYLRQFGIINTRSVGLSRKRQAFDRGNAYPAPNYLKRFRPIGTLEAMDCRPTGGEKPNPTQGSPPCVEQPPSLFNGEKIPTLERGEAPIVDPPKDNRGTEPARP
jgi:virulence factor Mce-like protein